jgi:large subunit ribosomal protein L35
MQGRFRIGAVDRSREQNMPKMKTHSGAKKRFKITGSGKITRRKANLNHILEKKSPARKRRLSGDFELAPGDAARVRRQLGI